MPQITLYIKNIDMPVWKMAKLVGNDSLSALVTEALINHLYKNTKQQFKIVNNKNVVIGTLQLIEK